ncbi:MAG: hypothetical protein ACXU89_22675 [Xanthobacteraceae bacterium]
MNLQHMGDSALRSTIDDMRLMPHPAKQWVSHYKLGEVHAIEKIFKPSAELVKEALAEIDALKTDKPAKPYQRRVSAAAVTGS